MVARTPGGREVASSSLVSLTMLLYISYRRVIMAKAIIYDFDGTLTPDPVPDYQILDASGLPDGMRNPKFMEMAKTIAKERKFGLVEGMIWAIIDVLEAGGFEVTDDNLTRGAEARTFNPGVKDFLKRSKSAGVKNYVVSSGAKVFINRTEVAPYIEKVYASELNYDLDGKATGIKLALDEERKTSALKEIAQEINGDAEDCSGLIYVGDGLTDVPAMQFIKDHGGETVLVFRKEMTDEDRKIQGLGIVDFVAEADFTEGKELAKILTSAA